MAAQPYKKISTESDDGDEPSDSTSLWSRMTFSWVSEVLARGSLSPLNLSDLGKAMDQRTSQDICEKFQRFWDDEKLTATEDPRAWKALARLLNGRYYIFHVLTLLLLSCLRISQPVFLSYLLLELSRDSASITWLSCYTVGLCLCGIIRPFVKASFYYAAELAGTHFNTAITGAVYQKVSTSVCEDGISFSELGLVTHTCTFRNN